MIHRKQRWYRGEAVGMEIKRFCRGDGGAVYKRRLMA